MSDIKMAAHIVSAFVSNNTVRADEIVELLKNVHEKMRAFVDTQSTSVAAEKPVLPMPWKKTIHHEHLISLEDLKPYKTLKRHLAGHGLTLEDYKAKWGLPSDYPGVAAEYSQRRSSMAKQNQLGQSRKKAENPAQELKVKKQTKKSRKSIPTAA